MLFVIKGNLFYFDDYFSFFLEKVILYDFEIANWAVKWPDISSFTPPRGRPPLTDNFDHAKKKKLLTHIRNISWLDYIKELFFLLKKEGHDWCNDCCFLLFSLVRSDFEIAKWVNVNELFSSWKVINLPPPPQRPDNYIIAVWQKVLPKNTLILEQVQWSLSLLMVSVLSFSCLLMNLKLNNGQKNSMQSAKKWTKEILSTRSV